MIDRHSAAVLLLVIVIIVQEIQIILINKKVHNLFSAYELMCNVNEKQFETIKQIIKYSKEQSEAIDKFVNSIVVAAKRSHDEEEEE